MSPALIIIMPEASRRFKLVLVTAPESRTAKRLARLALEQRLAACANIVPALESHYWWKGRVERSREVLILFKTTGRLLRALEQLVIAEHPYDTPEFVALSVSAGNKRYLQWWAEAVHE